MSTRSMAALALGATLAATPALAQPAGPVTSMQCAGIINGVASQATVQIERLHAGPRSPGASSPASPNAHYTFQGELTGGLEGFISLVEHRTRERIDRVYIGAVPGGFMIRAENSAPHTFRCQ
jgi:hypothetical protein